MASIQRHPAHRGSKRYLQWVVGILSFAFGILSFRLLHSTSLPRKDAAPSDCPMLLRRFTQPANHKATTTAPARFAYAFLISGCDPSSPLTYRPYLFNILVATKILIDSGSHADVVVMIQLQKEYKELPSQDLAWLQLYPSTIRIHYLPPLLRDNFYNAQLAKFHILELVDYQRVMYLDADVMPLCSMDYLFEISSQGRLQPNVVLGWFTEPSHGGLFILKPGNYNQWQAVVERREKEALSLPYPHWDPVRGWGTVLKTEWHGLPQPAEILPDGSHRYAAPRHSTNWTFHGDFADQGLLYYWTRFHQKAVSILYLDTVMDFLGEDDVKSYERPSSEIFGSSPNTSSCLPAGKEYLGEYGSTLHAPLFYGKVPHRDFCHFSGGGKPWEMEYHEFPTKLESSTDFWYSQLHAIFQDFSKQHPRRNLPTLPLKYKSPSLGRYPTHRSMIGTIQKKLRQQERRNEQEQLAREQNTNA